MKYYNYTLNIWTDEAGVRAALKGNPSNRNFCNFKRGHQLILKGWVSEDTYNIAPKVKDPDGNIHTVLPNASQFAKKHDLRPDSFRRILMGKGKQHKGWTFYANRPVKSKRLGRGIN